MEVSLSRGRDLLVSMGADDLNRLLMYNMINCHAERLHCH